MRRMYLQNAAFHWQTQGHTKKRGTSTIYVIVDFQALALDKSMLQKSEKYVCTFQTVRTLLFSTFLLMHRKIKCASVMRINEGLNNILFDLRALVSSKIIHICLMLISPRGYRGADSIFDSLFNYSVINAIWIDCSALNLQDFFPC